MKYGSAFPTTFNLLPIAAAGFLASCAPAMKQPGSCAFGDVAEGGTPVVAATIQAGVYEQEDVGTVRGGPEDFAVIKMTKQSDDGRWRLFISAVKRPGNHYRGHIRTVVFDAATGEFKDETLEDATPDDFKRWFHPVGISLVEHDGQPYLYVINKRDKAGRGGKKLLNRIEKFLIDVESGELTYVDSLKSPDLIDANDLLVTGDEHVYVSNPRVPNIFKARGEDYSNWPSLVHHHASMEATADGDVFQRVDRQFSFANGIAKPREDRLIVADFWGGRLAVFDRNEQTGELRHMFDVDLGDAGAPDNLMLSEDRKKLYIAVHKSKVHSFLHLQFDRSHAPSAVYELDMTELAIDEPPKGSLMPKLVLDDGGEHLKAASTALAIGKYMLVSQLKDPEIRAFDCQ